MWDHVKGLAQVHIDDISCPVYDSCEAGNILGTTFSDIGSAAKQIVIGRKSCGGEKWSYTVDSLTPN